MSSIISLEGKVALVTGAASGIGRAVTLALAGAGAALVVSDIDADAGHQLAQELVRGGHEALFVQADVTQAAQVQQMVLRAVQTYGRLDVAHNNVGGGTPNPSLTELSEAEWDRTFDLCIKSTWLCMKHQIPQMLAQGAGVIVNTAALAGQVVTEKASPAYSAAKAGVIHLTRHAAVVYGRRGLRINSVSPGLTATPDVLAAMTEQQIAEVVHEHHPIPRMAAPSELAAAVLWLCSESASFINGVNLPVDGGWAAR
jgi:NAD(P)-dependent dehydrogenase (short-subunit alcohol dehydrogenase family)